MAEPLFAAFEQQLRQVLENDYAALRQRAGQQLSAHAAEAQRLQQRIGELEAQLRGAENAVAEAQQARAAEESRAQTYQREVEAGQAREQQLLKQIQESESARKQAEQATAELLLHQRTSQTVIEKLVEQYTTLADEYEQYRLAAGRAPLQTLELERLVNEGRQEITALSTELEEAVERSKSLEAQLGQMQAQLDDARAEASDAKRERSEREARALKDVEAYKTEVLQFNARLKQAEYENNILRKELERIRTSVTSSATSVPRPDTAISATTLLASGYSPSRHKDLVPRPTLPESYQRALAEPTRLQPGTAPATAAFPARPMPPAANPAPTAKVITQAQQALQQAPAPAPQLLVPMPMTELVLQQGVSPSRSAETPSGSHHYANEESDFNLFTGEPRSTAGANGDTRRNRLTPSTRMSWVDSPPRRGVIPARTSAYSSEGFTANVLPSKNPSTTRGTQLNEASVASVAAAAPAFVPLANRVDLDRMTEALAQAKRIREQFDGRR